MKSACLEVLKMERLKCPQTPLFSLHLKDWWGFTKQGQLELFFHFSEGSVMTWHILSSAVHPQSYLSALSVELQALCGGLALSIVFCFLQICSEVKSLHTQSAHGGVFVSSNWTGAWHSLLLYKNPVLYMFCTSVYLHVHCLLVFSVFCWPVSIFSFH